MRYAKPSSSADDGKFYGHSPNADGKGNWQLLFDHIHGATATQPERGVALLARDRASYFGAGEKAFLAGLLHDLGKYSPTFTKRLMGAALKLDHWTAGAWVALRDYKSVEIALAIEGHHIGLQQGAQKTLERLFPGNPELTLTKGLQLTETDDPNADRLKARWEHDLAQNGVACPAPWKWKPLVGRASDMLSVRMLFSALVDADFLDTENHFSVGKVNHTKRPQVPELDAKRARDRANTQVRDIGYREIPELNAEQARNRVRDYLAELECKADSNTGLQALRKKLGDDCVVAASLDELLFTLTAPTGSGKTLAMLLFALEKAAREPGKFRRIVVALPYLSILDQTAAIYRKLFPEAEFGTHYILEHHSLAGLQVEPQNADVESENGGVNDARQNEARLLTENWDAPIILTTNVQLFESLHANHPSACRKLHNLAGSIMLCDEVQTLPDHLAVPTLGTLSALATPTYNTAVVFATATQPAFNALHEVIKQDRKTSGWAPREIVADPPAMFRQAANLRPVHADWSAATAATGWATIAKWLADADQAMAIVNLRRHSVELAQLLEKNEVTGLEYISTYLCPAHRRQVLDRVKKALDDKTGKTVCRLVATSCVEAGVDLDFPLVCRALAGLEAIAQAAGRCNREGKLSQGGTLRVFLPEGDPRNLYPDGTYALAAHWTQDLIHSEGGPDLSDPQVFTRYFENLYDLKKMKKEETLVQKAVGALDFVDTAKLYRLIDKQGINVIVPFGEEGRRLCDAVLADGLNRERIRQARQFTVSVFADTRRGTPAGLQPLILASSREIVPDWFLLKDQSLYHPKFGLAPDENQNGAGLSAFLV